MLLAYAHNYVVLCNGGRTMPIHRNIPDMKYLLIITLYKIYVLQEPIRKELDGTVYKVCGSESDEE